MVTSKSFSARIRTGTPLSFAAMSDTRRGKDDGFDALRTEGVAGAEEPGAGYGAASKGPGAIGIL